MAQKKWTFLTNHGRLLIYLNDHTRETEQSLAFKLGLSIRTVQNILDDLVETGYLAREKIGRRNNYQVNLNKPMRHKLDRHQQVCELLLDRFKQKESQLA